ncbi:MAG: terpene cyclase/mutase family protein [Planctomycetaceae bacterium]|nr:terpene cyclase/mutase family protein [Planctomycetaceae bacterium]
MPTNYLINLTLKLLSGAGGIDAQHRRKLTDCFLSFQTETGGFCGRRGSTDIYYTAFALRGLFLSGGLDDTELQTSVRYYLQQERQQQLSAVELSSYIYSVSLLNLLTGAEMPPKEKQWAKEQLYRFRKEDGCFGTSENTPYSSVYQTFLTAAALELLGETEEVRHIPIEPVLRRQCSDGGFAELKKLRYSGTNPTAAAAAFLKMQDTEPQNRSAAVDFLLARQTPDGGFQANTRIPVGDLLSSFTAVTALNTLNAGERYDNAALNRFLRKLQLPSGGYRGAEWDTQGDVEYTFYGWALELLLNGSY